MKYREEIISIAQECDVDSALIASVVNTESHFDEKALSNKGAIGLMQILPSTAQWIAMKNNIEFKEERLFEYDYNLKIGSYYLSYLIAYFGDVKLGVCAYNAGQGNVSSWLKNKEFSSDGKTLKNIPFRETKEYLNRVLKSYNYYKYSNECNQSWLYE